MPGAFAGDPRDAFTPGGRTPEEEDVFAHLRRMIHVRQELEPLRRGELQQLYVADQQYAFARSTATESVLVAINNDTKPATWIVDLQGTSLGDGAVLQDRLGTMGNVTVANARVTVTLPARSAAVLTAR
jgi:glycosidase